MILTLGDSFTHGAELANPEQTAWPVKLGQLLGLEVDNQGRQAQGNTYIFRHAVRAVSQHRYDLVVIGWTDVSRIELTTSAGDPTSITAHHTQKIMASSCREDWVREYYARHYSDSYHYQLWTCYMLSLQGLFKQLKQPYLMINIAGLHDRYDQHRAELEPLWNQLDQSRFVGWPHRGMIEIAADAPFGPGGHPLELGHERIACEIAEHIRN